MSGEIARRAADVLAERLFEAGCRHAFGMPGGEVLTLLDAFGKAGIAFHLVKHENAGGFMAEGVWHRTGAPAILLATVGPGITNALNVAANAEQDRVPLIVISGCIDPADRVTYTHQVVDHRGIFAPVCKACFEMTAEACEAMADKAVNLALDPRPGPVHIDVPISVAVAAAPDAHGRRRAAPALTGPAQGAELQRARDWIKEAKRPLVIAGYDAVLDGSAASVANYCREQQLPLITTYKAKGILPEDDPLAVGSFSLSPSADEIIKPLISQADVIVLAGFDPIEVRAGWRNPWDPGQQKVIEFSSVVNTHFVYQATASFTCNIGEGLQALFDGVSLSGLWHNGAPAGVSAQLAEAHGQNDTWGPGAIAQELRSCLPKDAIAAIDTGAHRIVASQVWQCLEPETLLQSVGFGSMGCGLPLAIGAKLAEPERPVVAMTGDAGLLMTLGELATLADEKLPVIIVVFVDASLALIETKQRSRGLDNTGVDFPGGYDYVKIAQAFGGIGYNISSRLELRAAVGSALAQDCFSLLACHFDRQAYEGRL